MRCHAGSLCRFDLSQYRVDRHRELSLFLVYARPIVPVYERASPASYLNGGSGQDILLEPLAHRDQKTTNLV
jgi:hypothetical protein